MLSQKSYLKLYIIYKISCFQDISQSIKVGTLQITAKIYHTKTASKNEFLEDCSKVNGLALASQTIEILAKT